MTQIILGGLMLSIIHASIPNHWISLVALSKVEKWSRLQTIKIAAIAGLSYTFSTAIIGIAIGLFGYKLNTFINIIGSIYAPIVLIVLGFSYIIRGFGNSKSDFNRKHRRKQKHLNSKNIKTKTKKQGFALILVFNSALFFSPCLEIEAYYSYAGTIGLIGIILLSFIYIFVTIFGMIILVDLGSKGIRKLTEKFLFLEYNVKTISGSILILMGIISFFIKF